MPNNGMVSRRRAIVRAGVRAVGTLGGINYTGQGLQWLARNARWGSGRSGPATASRYFNPLPSPPYQHRRSPVTQGGAVKRTKLSHGPVGAAKYRGASGASKVIGGRKKRAYKKGYKRKYRKAKRVNMNNGVVGRIETVQKVQDLNAVYVGHSSFPINQVIEYVSRAIVKTFWAKEGILVESDSTVGPSVPSLFRFVYYATPVATTPTTFDSATMLANATFGTAFGNLCQAMRVVMDASENLFKWQTLTFLSTPTMSDYRFKHDANMVQTKIVGSIRSMLTMQNSTPNAADGSATDVNNANPLHVHKYHGSGNGTEMVVRTTTIVGPPVYTSFFCNIDRGNIAVVAKQTNGLHLDEPPSSKFFAGCKGGGKFTLQPGNIKKSTLYDTMDMSLSSYMNIVRGHLITVRQKIRKGSYEFFGFEKVVTTTVAGAASNVPVTIDYELDQKYAFKCIIKTKQMTLPVNSSQVAFPVLTVP